MQTLVACAAIYHPTLIAECLESGSGDAARGRSSISRCARSPIRSPIESHPRRWPGDGAVKPLATALGVLSALAPRRLRRAQAGEQGDARRGPCWSRKFTMPRANARKSCRASSRRASKAIWLFASRARWRSASSTRALWSRTAIRSPRLDETDFRLQLEQAEAERNSAHAALEQAEAEERRITTLTRQGWAANADFEKIHAAADQARGAVVKANARVTLARNALDYTTLDGRRGRRRQPGGRRARPSRRRRRADRPPRPYRRARSGRFAFPRTSSIACGRTRRASSSGRCRACRSARACASSRPTPTPRRAPIPRASASSTRRESVRLGMSLTVG